MNDFDIEARLKQARKLAGAPRSIVDDVMSQLPRSLPQPAVRAPWSGSALAAGVVVPTAVTVALAFLVLLTGPAVRLTLAEIQAAVERQAWVHIQYDVGQLKESWTDLRSGEVYTTRNDGNAVYINRQKNARLWYWKDRDVIEQDQPTVYAPGQTAPVWSPRTAWEEIVAPLEKEIAEDVQKKTTSPAIVIAQDSLNGKTVVRYDSYSTDSVGKRFLYAQLWADPETRLPVRLRTRLQLADREVAKKEWSTGDYDFPATGPADLYSLGVPRNVPIAKPATAVSDEVQPILDGIKQAHDHFLKNYRAVVWHLRRGPPESFRQLEIIWRDGDRLRQDYYSPFPEARKNSATPLPQLRAAELLAWASQNDPYFKQLMTLEREYTWRSAAVANNSKPKVHVIRHSRFPLLDTNDWPDAMQWPTRHFGIDFQLIDANEESVANCVGLRKINGNRRYDYYVDPGNDFVCVKQIFWNQRDGQWGKEREYILSELHRVENCVVAGCSTFIGYADPTQGLSGSTESKHIDIVPLKADQYPPDIFDPALLTTDADVDGF